MMIAIVVLAIAIVAATQWTRKMETRVDQLNRRIGEMEHEIRTMRNQGYR